ncbi:MAG: glycosyltransferase family 4 protein [bacterium]|nr:glycosyltransferase family 4 protein [bacterium]
MRVAVDGTPLTVSSGGISRYTAELSQELAREFPEDEYWLLSDQPFGPPAGCPANLRRGPGPRGALERRWWSYGVAAAGRRVRAEVFHGTDFSVPYLPIRPSVLTLHDLSPWRADGRQWGAERVSRRTPFLLRSGLATMIITPSEAIRREAIRDLGLPSARVVAVPLAAALSFRPVAPLKRQNPYFLYVGVVEPRKNISLIVEAWRHVRRKHPVDLVLAGRRREDSPAFRAEPGLEVLGEVAEQELPALYSGAVAFLYPSFYEGFGLPVLEAMACGTAVLTSADPALREVGGEATLALGAFRSEEWAAAMSLVLRRPQWRAELAARGLARAREFHWSRTAHKTREVYKEARLRFGC